MSISNKNENINGKEREYSPIETMGLKCRQLKEKQFELRNSLLTDLFEKIPHIETIHHIFVATLICLFVNTVVHDYFIHNEINLGMHLIYTGFRNIHIVIFVWLAFLSLTCFCYYAFNMWAKVRVNFPPKSSTYRMWDALWLLSVLGYYGFSFRLASFIVTAFKLPPASAAIVLLEQVRMLMKLHAFIRINAEQVVKFKAHSDMDMPELKFSKFVYFLFAPTLIYRNEYPRTKEIRWKFVIYRALEIAAVILYHSFIFHKFFIPPFKDFGLRKFTWNEIIVAVFENSIPGLLLKISGFYLILHSVQNLFAELLCFGDRLFYKDWWTSTSFSDYFRTWNLLVQDWLYTFVYKDIFELSNGNKILAKVAVFTLSALVHEWVLIYMFGFFFPALFFSFLFGASVLSFVKVPKTTVLNVLFWYLLSFGSGLLVSMYSLEYFARNNIKENTGIGSLGDYFLPKLLTCDCIV
ncbi:unnamed protein product [Phaedon cochleariae]|uniref:O-acyltransferase n=1 Tax=Phaedon cochleariae TaxID=80249 RepID=A0A9N9SHL6_PHACE|nr:unnamed protein product [Phaedon cochleariae]